MPNHSVCSTSRLSLERAIGQWRLCFCPTLLAGTMVCFGTLFAARPLPGIVLGSLQCVQPVRQCSSTCGTSIAVGCWQFPRPLITLCVCHVPFILSRVMFLLSFPVSLRKMANQRIDTGTLPYHIDRSSPFLDRHAATLG